MATGHSRDYAQIALDYARAAVKDRKGKKHGKLIRLAAKRFLDDIKRARARKEKWPYRFDAWHANDVCDFIEKLPHVEGTWDSATITLEPPQIFCLANIFGWRHKETGYRRFTQVYWETARKSAKSTITGAVANYCLTCEGEVGPQIVIGATTGEQAGKVFEPAKKMVDRTPDLQEAFGVKTWKRSITCDDNGGFIQTINSKGKTQDGWNPSVGILDELHAHKDRALFDVIKSSFGARKNRLFWIITTAGTNIGGVCYEQRSYAVKVLEGVVEADHLFAVIYTLDEGDDPFDESVWVKANPLIGVTPTWEWMRTEAKDAQASPSLLNNFKTKNLNMWLGSSAAWLNIERWKACGDPALSWEDFAALDCWIGVDLADKDDLCAATLIAFSGETLLVKPVFWIPEAKLHSVKDEVAPYQRWADEGLVEVHEGDWVDHSRIEQAIRDMVEDFHVKQVVFDQWAAARSMASTLNDELADPDEPIASILSKNARNVTDPSRELEARILAKKIKHDGSEPLTWCVSNAHVTRLVNGSLVPKKETPMSPMKIDGVDAMVNALKAALEPEEEEQKESVYEQRGVRSF